MGDSSNLGSDDSAVLEITGKVMAIAVFIFFSAVVFFFLLHIYSWWFWSRIEESSPSLRPRRRRRRFVFVPGQDGNLVRGLNPSVLRSLPVLEFNPEDFKDGLECAVCLSELVQGEKTRLLPKCNHGFHVDCIDMWFQSHSSCPICRNPVVSECSNSGGSESRDDGVSTESSPSLPTNVLFWGNEGEEVESQAVNSASSQSNPCTSSSMVVIDIPNEVSSSSLSSSGGFAEEELKSPVSSNRLRTLKRILSRERRVNPCTPDSVDVEQGERGQMS